VTSDNSIAMSTLLPHLPFPPLLSSEKKGWEGFVVNRYCLPPFEVPEHPMTGHRIIVELGRAIKIEGRQNGHLQKERFLRGDVSYVPPGTQCGAHWEEAREMLVILLEPSFVARTAHEVLQKACIETVPQFIRRDPLIEGLGLALGAELESDGSPNRLYAESLANVLAVQLLRRYSASTQPLREAIRALPKYRLRPATEFINDHLERDLTLAEIAAQVEMSPYHFARMFKQSTGLAPHQYVLEQRVERAKTLLADTQLPLVEIAYRLGFTDQSHFIAVFRRLTATTPKAYRKAL
jgi:AraC family transcriptional regulator